jgi:hypothetical protein
MGTGAGSEGELGVAAAFEAGAVGDAEGAETAGVAAGGGVAGFAGCGASVGGGTSLGKGGLMSWAAAPAAWSAKSAAIAQKERGRKIMQKAESLRIQA